MNLIALKMLIGDKAKYLGLVFGIAFATLLMSQQLSLFIGLMQRTASIVEDAKEVDIWVMDQKVQYIDGVEPIADINLSKVRSVDGVSWAVPFFKSQIVLRVNNSLQTTTLVGFDDTNFVGAPRKMVLGSLENIKKPDSIIIDQIGYKYIWPDQSLRLGDELEAADRRMEIVGISDSSQPFSSQIVAYTAYKNAVKFAAGRNQMSFILVKVKAGQDVLEVAKRIADKTGLKARSWHQFKFDTINYYLQHTGIPINFGITVALGFIIGAVISGQTFYIFIMENLKQFGALKAIGLRNSKILQMVLTQGATVAAIGFGIGIGMTNLFFQKGAQNIPAFKGFYLPWQVVALSAGAVIIIMLIASFFSIRKVFVVDPAIVFRG